MSRTVAARNSPAAGLPVLVAVSGAAALVYESLWLRSFGLIFGNTTAAVAMVLAVFMGGLALGSALAARRPSAEPLAAYARVELGAGATALLSLPLLRALPWAYGALVARSGLTGFAEAAGLAVLAALVLLPATVLLGATVPLALAFLERAGQDARAAFGRLYLLNTLGGAAGVTLAAFVLVPWLGVRATFLVAVASSIVVGGTALRWSREARALNVAASRDVPPADVPPAAAMLPARSAADGSRLAFVLAALSGAATFGVEVLWTRTLVLVIGSTAYAFNVVLVAILVGIALGAVLYTRWRPRIERPRRAASLLFVAAGFGVLAGQWLIGRLPSVWLWAVGVLPLSFAVHQLASFGLCLAALLPATALLGLSFPLLLHLAEAQDGSAQRASGRLYAWNTAGGLVAALAAGVWLVPRLGLQPCYLVFAGLLLGGGLVGLLAGARGRTMLLGAAAAFAAALVVAVPRWRPWDPVLMSSGVHRYALDWHDRLAPVGDLGAWLRQQRSLVFYREGSEAVVAVSQSTSDPLRRFLSVNGKTDAGSGAEDVVTQKFIAHVPMLLHMEPRRVLVIGWGAGATAASAALYPVEALDCVEIEPATWQAAPFFAGLSGQVARDPRFHLAFADGRNYLLRTRSRYDVIVSEPSNPWISGVSNLFTREFYVAARSALAPGGVFAQWFHYYSLAPADVKLEARTFLSVFPEASLWLVPPTVAANGARTLGADLLLVGSLVPQRLDWARLERAFADERLGADLRSTRVLSDPVALVASWAMGREELKRWAQDSGPAGARLNTDDDPYIELVAPRRAVLRPAETARAAAAQYEAIGGASGDVTRVIVDHPALAAGGAISAVFYDRLAERYAAAAQPERAITAFEAAVARDVADAFARARLGEILFERGRAQQAEPQLSAAVRLDPTRARAWEVLGMLALDRREYARAEAAHRALLRLEPANVSAWLRLGAALARQAKWAAAKDAFDTARSIDPRAAIDPALRAYVERRAASPSPGAAFPPSPAFP